MNTPTLVVEGIAKNYVTYRSELARFGTWVGIPARPLREFWALADVGFSLARGESVGVIGGNGAGKSTLLKLITGTVAPTRGRIEVAGSTAAILELGLNFNADLTGAENVQLYGGLLGMGPPEIAALEPSIRAFAEIGDAFDEPIRTYSTGMQARVAFGVVTAKRPDLLVVDEVLSVGDAYFQNKSFNRILQYRAAGTAIVFVTHGIEGVARICDRTIWLEGGTVVLDGPTSEVCDAYTRAVDERDRQAGASAPA